MRYTHQPPLTRPLPDGFTIRTVRDDQDVAKIAALSGQVHIPEVAPLHAHMLARYPGMEPADQFFVESPDGQVVSSLCLIPWTCRLESVTFPAAQMEIVTTAPAYRRRGLIRTQVAAYNERLVQRGCLLSWISGIPNFYRRFGYTYGVPLGGGLRLELRDIPTLDSAGYTIRSATLNDLETLATLYDDNDRDLGLSVLRSRALWGYLLGPQPERHVTRHRTWIVCDPQGAVAGYARLPDFYFGDDLVVDEASRMPLEATLALLAFLRANAELTERPSLRFELPAGHGVMRVARALGGRDLTPYGWQVACPDLPALLRALLPVLNQRLAQSVFCHHTQRLRISSYSSGFALQIEAGRVAGVEELAPDESCDCELPADALLLLVLGVRDTTSLRATYPDVRAYGLDKLLLDTLFPTLDAYFYPCG